MEVLDEDDEELLKRFLLTSGSLKEMCVAYGISYPTMRGRLDRLIARVKAADERSARESFDKKLQGMVREGKVSTDVARELWKAHRGEGSRGNRGSRGSKGMDEERD